MAFVAIFIDNVTDEIAASTVPRNALATEVRANLARFPKSLLLTRVGQFYEVCITLGFNELDRLINQFSPTLNKHLRSPLC